MLKKYLHKNTIRYFLLVCAAVATLLLVGYLTPSDRMPVSEWRLLKTPESAVELYFTAHGALPKKYTPGGTSLISFTVASHDTKKTLFPFEVTQQDEATGATTMLSSGEMRLENNQTASKEIPVTYSDGGVRSKITIRLPEEKQTIHYWVEKQ